MLPWSTTKVTMGFMSVAFLAANRLPLSLPSPAPVDTSDLVTFSTLMQVTSSNSPRTQDPSIVEVWPLFGPLKDISVRCIIAEHILEPKLFKHWGPNSGTTQQLRPCRPWSSTYDPSRDWFLVTTRPCLMERALQCRTHSCWSFVHRTLRMNWTFPS